MKIEGELRKLFLEFYPSIKHPENEVRYAMVLTQSCDLVRSKNREPKLMHINLCLVKTLESITKHIADKSTHHVIQDKQFLLEEEIDTIKNNLSKLLNNNEQKIYFFLPKQKPFTNDMVAILPLSFSFRVNNYDLLLKNRVLALDPVFQSKMGAITGQLYSRIGTPDLETNGWKNKDIEVFINHLLKKLNLIGVPDYGCIDYIKKNYSDMNSDTQKLISDYKDQPRINSYKKMKKELTKEHRDKIINLFEDRELVQKLMDMKPQARGKKIGDLLQSPTAPD